MKDRDKAEAIATERTQLIAPLLGDHVDAALARQLKATMSAQSGLSERTIRRYVARYQAEGFRGLLPASHPASDSPSGAIVPDILEQAIQLRREAPHRSVRQIIQVLEWEGRVTPGQIKRSTLPVQHPNSRQYAHPVYPRPPAGGTLCVVRSGGNSGAPPLCRRTPMVCGGDGRLRNGKKHRHPASPSSLGPDAVSAPLRGRFQTDSAALLQGFVGAARFRSEVLSGGCQAPTPSGNRDLTRRPSRTTGDDCR